MCLTNNSKAQMIAGFSFDDNICVGSCISFTDTTIGVPIEWNWDFGIGVNPITSTEQNPSEVCFNTVGVYSIQLTVTDAAGVSASTNNSITVFELPTIAAEHDTIVDLGQVVNLNSTTPNYGDILWSPSTYYIECDTCRITTAIPESDTDYIVVITDYNGCTAQDTVKVIVNFIEGIDLPQAFSPNADGNNDILRVKGYGIDNMTLKIFNRNGQLVYMTTDSSEGWDGNHKGKVVNPGTYVWMLNYKLINGSTGTKSGSTTLIK
jgi:gliding motility-associated-like protein